ncbi:sugar phosphate isomerase/epimerase [Sphaerochaeta sp. PS]|uniref:sugar phosphate isomerase/epimerase family protein n=1 Tax=Sphaerochaeta sp. PS TaxID=3076336 RepID=UPI0028A5288B|nr:sugar phosphate isomerase/epimerase [Sphaerochaeta sp. PS]MDT4762518.1 sugar phosphate isomerase/epimerase [Sphaerochaeta sp. PS]
MKIATSTNLISYNRDNTKTEMVNLLPFYAKEGMQLLDLNFCEMLNPSSILRSGEYPSYIQRLDHLKRQHSLTFNQSHAPYVGDRLSLPESEAKEFDKLLARSLECNMKLSIPILVVHPIKGSVEDNLAYYRPFVAQAEKARVKLAFENLNDLDEITEIGDLIALTDAFASDSVGICYDFGHAHMRGHDIQSDILAMKERLVATHVADNHGERDEHLLPFYGTIDWKRAVQALRNIGYSGDLTYECMFFNQHLPSELKVFAIRQAKLVGEYLLAL